MTGKDLIIYILQNDLEYKPVFQNGKFLDFITAEEAAVKFDVGIHTIYIWFELGIIDGVKFRDKIYILANAKPKKELDFHGIEEAVGIFIENVNERKNSNE